VNRRIRGLHERLDAIETGSVYERWTILACCLDLQSRRGNVAGY